MNKASLLPAILVVLILLLTALSAKAASPLEGLWLTQNERSVIKLEACEQGLCGAIHWIIEGGMQTDASNPDESLKNRPMCGLPILWGFEQDSQTEWEDGKIYKADEGDMYDANIKLLKDGTLKVRGYMGVSFLGKTQIWHRVDESKYPACKV